MLIASGYRALAWMLILIYVLPLLLVTAIRRTPRRASLPETP